MLIAFFKPYGVLSQFSQEVEGQKTLADFKFPSRVYPVGRLDSDSEGLLLLSDERMLIDALLNPQNKHPRTYWVQVEGLVTEEALEKLRCGGLEIKGHRCAPAEAFFLGEDIGVPPRVPPVRYRASIPTSWLELVLTEGKNRQVRRMTAAVGFPTLRLIRVAIGGFSLERMKEGEWTILSPQEKRQLLR